jgi:DNA-binding IclR family transcriptional regulator
MAGDQSSRVTVGDSSGAQNGLSYISQQIQRALDVIEAIAEAPRGLTLTELAEVLELPKSSVLRLVANLEMRRYVEQDQNNRYRIGLRVFSIGGRALADNILRTCARPYLEDLALRVGESTYLAILDQEQALYIDRIESPMPVRSHSPIGSHRPLLVTAVGKVLLAGMGPVTAADVLKSYAERDSLAPPASDDLHQRLQRVAADGYAIDIGEYDEGLTCIAAPIRDGHGDVIAALGLSGPSWRIPDDRLPTVVGLLIENAQGVSRELGHEIADGHSDDGSTAVS